ncbi:MAG: extradiol ring-cleavage dioxygenase [Rhodospirillales bacterium]|nr:extradiol ring-cleavage dioxygenase [Rhodospirillales bacterium]
MPTPSVNSRASGDRLPETPLFDRNRALAGYALNKMANGLSKPANRQAFTDDEAAYLDRFALTPEQKTAVIARDWNEMMRLGGNLFYMLKISAVDPVAMTRIGAAQAGMEHDDFLRRRLGKTING